MIQEPQLEKAFYSSPWHQKEKASKKLPHATQPSLTQQCVGALETCLGLHSNAGPSLLFSSGLTCEHSLETVKEMSRSYAGAKGVSSQLGG